MGEGVSVKNSACWGRREEGLRVGGEEEDGRLTGGAHLNGFGSAVFARHFHAWRVVARRMAARSASSRARWTLFGPATTAPDGVLISYRLRVGCSHMTYRTRRRVG